MSLPGDKAPSIHFPLACHFEKIRGVNNPFTDSGRADKDRTEERTRRDTEGERAKGSCTQRLKATPAVAVCGGRRMEPAHESRWQLFGVLHICTTADKYSIGV